MKFTKFGKALLTIALSTGVIFSVTSCVQSYTVGFLYVTGTVTAQSAGNGIISGYQIDHNTGVLATIDGMPISSGGANPVRAVLLAGSRFLYVLNRGVSTNPAGSSICTTKYPCANSNIVLFTVGGDGILTAQETFFTQGVNPFRIAADSSGSYLYVLDHDAPDSAAYTGKTPTANNPNSCIAALTAAVPSCGDITAFSISQTTGRLTPIENGQITSADCPTSQIPCPLTYFPVPANPIDFVFYSGQFLTLSGTPASGDSVFPYNYTATSGQLTITQNSSQPLNIAQATAIVNGGGYVYVLDDEGTLVPGTGATSQILPYTVVNGALDPQTGGAVADDTTLSNPVALLLESKGKFLYVANLGNNANTTNPQSGVAGYVLDASTRQLSFIAGEPFTAGAGPQCIVEDPSNQFIYMADFNDSSVNGLVVDPNSGVLTKLRVNKTYPLQGPATWCLIDGRTG